MIVFDVLVYVLALIGFLTALKWTVLFVGAGGQIRHVRRENERLRREAVMRRDQ